MEVISKDDFLQHFTKMDAVSIQGVWLAQYPTGKAPAARLHYYAGIYAWLMERWREEQAKLDPKEPPHQLRKRMLKMAEDRIVRDDTDDLLTILSV